MAKYSVPLAENIRSVNVKSYGNLKIQGNDLTEVDANSSNSETTTIVQSDGVVYVTAMSNCVLSVPKNLPIVIEKGMGSVHCKGMAEEIKIQKVLGKLVVDGARSILIEKIGGNCSLWQIDESIQIDKIGGNLAVENFNKLQVDKMGGNCLLKSAEGEISIRKIGGNFSGEGLKGSLLIEKVGGDFTCDRCSFGINLSVGGDVTTLLSGEVTSTSIKAGGDIKAYISKDVKDINLSLSAEGDIKIKALGLDVSVENNPYEQSIGNPTSTLELSAGGDIHLVDSPWQEPETVGDLSAHFKNGEMSVNELVHDQVRRATEMASRRIEEAQKNLEQIQSKVDVKFDEIKTPNISIPPIPSIPIKPAPKKGASDEERLLILQMLQEKKITVDEAEKLFRSLEK